MPSIPGGSEYDKGSRAAAAEKAAVLIARRKLMTTNTIVKKAGMIFQTKKSIKNRNFFAGKATANGFWREDLAF